MMLMSDWYWSLAYETEDDGWYGIAGDWGFWFASDGSYEYYVDYDWVYDPMSVTVMF